MLSTRCSGPTLRSSRDLSYIYFAEGESRDEEVPPERRAIAEVGYSVVREWHTPPGVRPDGTVDADRLREWVIEARRRLADLGRSIVGDLVIGEVLAYMPPDGDGLWPAEPVRDLIEDLRSQEFETGLHTGKFNSRGIIAGPRQTAAPRNASSPRSIGHGPTASPTGGRAPEPCCVRWRPTNRSGRTGRTISPSTSETTAPKPQAPGARSTWRRAAAR